MKKFLAITSLMFTCPALYAEDTKISLSTGYNYSSGKYGQSEPTKIKYVPIIGKYEYGRWLAKIVVPWVEVAGSSGVTSDESKIVIQENINKHTRESGLGDIVSSLTYTAFWLPKQKIVVDVMAKVKFATGSKSKGLSSGETDYSLAFDLYKTFDKTTLFGTVGRKFIGDPGSSSYSLQNVWYGTLGAAYKINQKNSMGLFIDLREAAWEYNSHIREYTIYHSHKFNQTYKLQSYLTTGNTESSVDYAGGIMLGISWQ